MVSSVSPPGSSSPSGWELVSPKAPACSRRPPSCWRRRGSQSKSPGLSGAVSRGPPAGPVTTRVRSALSPSLGPEERPPGAVLFVWGPPLRRREAPPGAAPPPRPGSIRSSSSWPLRPSRILRTLPASSAERPRARPCSLQPQGQIVPPTIGRRDPQRSWRRAQGRRMEPWGVWLHPPRPRSMLRRARGERMGGPGIPLAPWASAAWPVPQPWAAQAEGAEATGPQRLLSLWPVPACSETRGPPKASPAPQRRHREASGPDLCRYQEAQGCHAGACLGRGLRQSSPLSTSQSRRAGLDGASGLGG